VPLHSNAEQGDFNEHNVQHPQMKEVTMATRILGLGYSHSRLSLAAGRVVYRAICHG